MLETIFQAVYIVGFILASAIRVPARRQQKQNRVKEDRETGLDKLLTFLPFVGMFFIPAVYIFTPWLDFADYPSPYQGFMVWAGWLGAVLFALGIWMLWRSHADLGRNWSPTLEIREGQNLITQGVYRLIRHPMYAAHLVWGIAQVLILQNWIAGPAMLVTLLPLYLVRVPQEEKMLLETFGDEYRHYMERTGKVFPRL